MTEKQALLLIELELLQKEWFREGTKPYRTISRAVSVIQGMDLKIDKLKGELQEWREVARKIDRLI